MAPKSRSIHYLSRRTIGNAVHQSITPAKPEDSRNHVYAPRQPSPSELHGTVTSSITGQEHDMPLNKPKVFKFIVEHENKNERFGGTEMTFVPNPVPDTGFRPIQAQFTEHPIVTVFPSLPTHPISASFKSAQVLPLSTFSPLPPLLSLAPTPTVKLSSPQMEATSSPSLLGPAAVSLHKAPNTLIIILLAVGSGLLLAGIFIIVKFCVYPTRRTRLTPSLPILNDSFSDYDKFQPKDSPIFGGPEKVSPVPGHGSGLLSWTQYTQTEQAVPDPVPVSLPERVPHHDYSERTYYPFMGHAHTSSVPAKAFGNGVHLPPMQQAYRALGRAERRSSAPSMSPYFSSPRYSLGAMTVNSEFQSTKPLAIDGRRDAGRPGHKILERSRTVPMHDGETQQEVGGKRHSQGFAYDGAVVSSPTCVPCVVPLPISAPSRGGRTRIKSTYFAPGSYPRMSNLPTKATVDRSDPAERPHKPYIQKSASCRDRDTQALTYALGLSPPATHYAIPSPQPTLYPDDSLSIVESRSPQMQSRKKHAEADRLSLPKIVTDVDGSAALGSLMLMDFGAEGTDKKGATSYKPLRDAIPDANSSQQAGGPSKKIARNDEKPPHIPSPPPMPSLAQMALEHTNPEAYADYKSPTYSIYGFYEHERKSGSGY